MMTNKINGFNILDGFETIYDNHFADTQRPMVIDNAESTNATKPYIDNRTMKGSLCLVQSDTEEYYIAGVPTLKLRADYFDQIYYEFEGFYTRSFTTGYVKFGLNIEGWGYYFIKNADGTCALEIEDAPGSFDHLLLDSEFQNMTQIVNAMDLKLKIGFLIEPKRNMLTLFINGYPAKYVSIAARKRSGYLYDIYPQIKTRTNLTTERLEFYLDRYRVLGK